MVAKPHSSHCAIAMAVSALNFCVAIANAMAVSTLFLLVDCCFIPFLTRQHH